MDMPCGLYLSGEAPGDGRVVPSDPGSVGSVPSRGGAVRVVWWEQGSRLPRPPRVLPLWRLNRGTSICEEACWCWDCSANFSVYRGLTSELEDKEEYLGMPWDH